MNPPAQHVTEAWQSAEFYANKVLMEHRNTDRCVAKLLRDAFVNPNRNHEFCATPRSPAQCRNPPEIRRNPPEIRRNPPEEAALVFSSRVQSRHISASHME